MVRFIEQSIKSQITGLSFIERYGGVAIPVSITQQTKNGPVIKVLPVSCDVDDTDCLETGKHPKLVPNSTYKSVAYLEEQGSTTVNFAGAKAGEITATSRIRLVVWLNMQKLGYDDCKGTNRFELETLNAIKGFREFTVDGVTGTVNISRTSIVQKVSTNIFAKYSYSDHQWAFFWPYDYFAVDFDATVKVGAGCLTSSTEQTVIECITNW